MVWCGGGARGELLTASVCRLVRVTVRGQQCARLFVSSSACAHGAVPKSSDAPSSQHRHAIGIGMLQQIHPQVAACLLSAPWR
jgi:hypothetical protein